MVQPFVGIPENNRRGRGVNHRGFPKRTLYLLQNLIYRVVVFDTSACVKMGTVEQYFGQQRREPHGDAGFVYLGNLLGGKEANLCDPRLLP